MIKKVRAGIREPLSDGITALMEILISEGRTSDANQWAMDNGVDYDVETGEVNTTELDVVQLQELYNSLDTLTYGDPSTFDEGWAEWDVATGEEKAIRSNMKQMGVNTLKTNAKMSGDAEIISIEGEEYFIGETLDEKEVDGFELSLVETSRISDNTEFFFVLLNGGIEWGPCETEREAREWYDGIDDGYYDGYYDDDEDDVYASRTGVNADEKTLDTLGEYNFGDVITWTEEYKDDGDNDYAFVVVEDRGDLFVYETRHSDMSKVGAFGMLSLGKKEYVETRRSGRSGNNKQETKKASFSLTSEQNYKVIEIFEDSPVTDKSIALLERENDYVVAWAYDTSDGTWGQGYYDFETRAEARKFIKTKYKV